MHAWGCRWTHTEIYWQNHPIFLPCPRLDTLPTEVYAVLYCNLLFCIQCERSMPSFTSCQTAAHLKGLLQQHELPCRLCIQHQLTHKYTHPLLNCLNSFWNLSLEKLVTWVSPLKMQNREKWSCQILKEGCWVHRDGRPVVRRTFLAGLEACLFTKWALPLWDEERGQYWERKRTRVCLILSLCWTFSMTGTDLTQRY